jgi:hypothetical protein
VRDLQLSDFSQELRDKLRDEGIELPRSVINRMTKEFFKHAEKTVKNGEGRFMLWQRDITSIYNRLDEVSLCNELANGEKVLTADYLIRKNKMQKNARRYYKMMPMTLPE